LTNVYGFDSSVNRITGLAVANFDEDHLSDVSQTIASVNPRIIYRNPSVPLEHVIAIKRETGAGPAVRACTIALARTYTAPAPVVDWGGAALQFYWVNYPWATDTNNLSLVTFLKFGTAGILVPGDLERPGWQRLLLRDDFKEALRGTNVLVASHHGRESGLEQEIFNYCTPEIVIVSDKHVEYETQRTDYGRYATGVWFSDSRVRKAVSTRNNGDITIVGPLWGVSSIFISKL